VQLRFSAFGQVLKVFQQPWQRLNGNRVVACVNPPACAGDILEDCHANSTELLRFHDLKAAPLQSMTRPVRNQPCTAQTDGAPMGPLQNKSSL